MEGASQKVVSQYCQARQFGWKGRGKLGMKGCSKPATQQCEQCHGFRCNAHLFRGICMECVVMNHEKQEEALGLEEE